MIFKHTTYDNEADITTVFNHFYSSIDDIIANSIQSNVPLNNVNNLTQYISRPPTSFFFSPVTHYIIGKIITSLKNKSGNNNTCKSFVFTKKLHEKSYEKLHAAIYFEAYTCYFLQENLYTRYFEQSWRKNII